MLKTIFSKNNWKTLRLLMVIYCVMIALFIAFLLYLPNQYKAQGLYAPSPELQSSSLSSLAGSLGGLAGMAGINLGGNKRDNLKIALEIIKSKAFIYKIIADKHLEVNVFAAKNWDPISKKITINNKYYDDSKQKWVRDVKLPKTAKPSDFEFYKVFIDNLAVSFDEKTKMVKLAYQHVSPVFAKKVVDLVVNSINETIQNREIKEAKTSIHLLNKAIKETEYAEMRTLLYDLVQEQIKRLLLAQTKEYYVLEPVDLPIIAEEKSSPKRGLILIVVTFLYGIISLFILLLGTKTKDD